MAIYHFYDNQFHKEDKTTTSEKSLAAARNIDDGSLVEYTNVGIGKPLCIEMVTLYIGDAPKRLFGGKPDLLVLSGVKGPATFDAAQQAINLLKKDIKNRTYIRPGEARSKGTSVVYYTDALDASELNFSFDLVAESFSTKVLSDIEKLFEKAAKMPLFVTSSTKLIAGAGIVGFIKKLGKVIFESSPFMSDDLPITVDIGGFRDFQPGVKLICQEGDELTQKCDLKPVIGINNDVSYYMVDKSTGKKYDGGIPYILLNVDGKKRRDLASFQPKIASAAMLSRFYGTDDDNAGFELLESALTLSNDLSFVKKIKHLEKEMVGGDPSSDQFKQDLALLKAYKDNIQNEELSKTIEIKEPEKEGES